MRVSGHIYFGRLLLLLTTAYPLWGQLGLLRRDDPQSGLPRQQAADKEDVICLAKARDMKGIQACDSAEIHRQELRMMAAYDVLMKMETVNRDLLQRSQNTWRNYKRASCEMVGSLFGPADMGKHQTTCEWRVTRQRADELEFLIKNATH